MISAPEPSQKFHADADRTTADEPRRAAVRRAAVLSRLLAGSKGGGEVRLTQRRKGAAASFYLPLRLCVSPSGRGGGNDLRIAAIALTYDLTVAIHNGGEFSMGPGLRGKTGGVKMSPAHEVLPGSKGANDR